ncbi:nitroreductase family protein [Bacillus sp. DJP31]|uniref:nitroreductase family protein n=1 Tax=Bacillus sp. DJP31 TaxID=3409789 RepID=UPI003BB48F85
MEKAFQSAPEVVNGIEKVIRERRSIREYRDEPVERELIIELLSSSVWAPNHLKCEPWRFILVDGEKREQMLKGIHDYYKSIGFLEKYSENQLLNYKEQFLRIPAQLIVVMKDEEQEKRWEEAFAATCALVQNFQLLAWERGLGVVWKTNEHNASPIFKRSIGVLDSEKIVGILQLGYPLTIPKPKPRRSLEELITIL